MSPTRRWSVAVAVVFGALVLSAGAHADISQNVQKAFKGQILITSDPLPDAAGEDKETIAAYRKAAKEPVQHAKERGVATWDFHFLAFMNRGPGVEQVSLDFFTTDKEKLFVAQKRLTGVDPKLTVLRGRIQINEDEGLNPGQTYEVKLAATVRGREVVLATTRVTAK